MLLKRWAVRKYDNHRTKKIQVAKDRAIDELTDLVGDGYWNRSPSERAQIRDIANLISLHDDVDTTLAAMYSYINGEEDLFFTP